MNQLSNYLDKFTTYLYKINKQMEEIEYRLIMIEEQIKDSNESLEAIKHNLIKGNK